MTDSCSNGCKWHVTMLTHDGRGFIRHEACDDLKEVQAVATEMRSQKLLAQIWIRPPAGRTYSWD